MKPSGTDPEAERPGEAAPVRDDGVSAPTGELAAAEGGVWGPWATAGLGLAVVVLFMAVQVAVAVAVVLALTALDPAQDPGTLADRLAGDGLVLAVAIWGSTLAAGGLLAVLVVLRRGAPLATYLGLVPVSWRGLATALLATLALAAVYDVVCLLLDHPVVPPFMLEAYRTCRWPPALWGAVVVAAPVFEEAFFRGFLLEGWRRSGLGWVGAAVLTALLWAGIHLQYGVVEIAAIFVLGLVLAVIRARTGSLVPCVAAHALVNLVATVEAALQA